VKFGKGDWVRIASAVRTAEGHQLEAGAVMRVRYITDLYVALVHPANGVLSHMVNRYDALQSFEREVASEG
jgi:hypothetical protein